MNQPLASKEAMLKRIRKALLQHTNPKQAQMDWESDVYSWPEEEDDDAVLFARQFTAVQGKFVYAETNDELAASLKELVEQAGWKHIFCYEPSLQAILEVTDVPFSTEENMVAADVAITTCEALVARFGTVVVGSKQVRGRTSTIFPPVHLVVAFRSQLAPDIKTALHLIREKYAGSMPSMLSFTTGPSRTADIEKTLVLGAHGPKELYLILVED
jgi:L-lactate dehydrogenase complex protein LldG